MVELLRLLTQQDSQRVGLFPGRAAHHAYPNLFVALLPLKQLGKHVARQRFKAFGIAEELGDADQQVLKQTVAFFRLFLQHPDVVFDGVDLQSLHPPLNTPGDRGLFVLAKIVPAAFAQPDMDLHQMLADLLAERIEAAV